MDEGRDEFRNRTKAAAEVNATKFGLCVYVANGATSLMLEFPIFHFFELAQNM